MPQGFRWMTPLLHLVLLVQCSVHTLFLLLLLLLLDLGLDTRPARPGERDLETRQERPARESSPRAVLHVSPPSRSAVYASPRLAVGLGANNGGTYRDYVRRTLCAGGYQYYQHTRSTLHFIREGVSHIPWQCQFARMRRVWAAYVIPRKTRRARAVAGGREPVTGRVFNRARSGSTSLYGTQRLINEPGIQSG